MLSHKKTVKFKEEKSLVDDPCLGILSQSYQFVWSSQLGQIVETMDWQWENRLLEIFHNFLVF